ncbi:MAG: TIGR04282 family arsenosugar biosynthesis glycosyltransferase [Chloroflexota bacterium]
MGERDALAVMARYPQVGQVKTRLAVEIGAAAATDLYTGFLRDIYLRLSGPKRPWRLYWAYTPVGRSLATLLGEGNYVPQRGGDLGDRLHSVFRDLLGRGFRRVAIIGSDSPHLPVDWIEQAFAALAEADVVLGPADDGGYYLIGLRQAHDLFRGIAWSTEKVLAQTLERAKELGLTVALLPRTFDVDDGEGLDKLRDCLDGDGRRRELPHTSAVLAGLPAPAWPRPLAFQSDEPRR